MMRSQNTVTIISLLLALLTLVAPPVLAQVQPVTGDCGFPGVVCKGGETVDNVVIFLEPLINMVLVLIGTIAVIFLIYAGIKYISSGGSEEDAATAKRQILYAVVGIVIALG
ncbi:MAG: hypothetical protein HY372_04185, partial [Candidatus Andersenbacteria bacterium]|nr:hypothetical protein [Candidatus Andersenbacteria bacterium]